MKSSAVQNLRQGIFNQLAPYKSKGVKGIPVLFQGIGHLGLEQTPMVFDRLYPLKPKNPV